MEIPETRYARNGDVNIAYQVFRTGALDLVYVPGWDRPRSPRPPRAIWCALAVVDGGRDELKGVPGEWQLWSVTS